jgi:arsenite oxidase small subunit
MQVGAVSSATVVLGSVFPGRTIAELSDQETLVTYYSRRKVANLSRLNVDEPYLFNYPHEGPHTSAMLIKLGTIAGGGIGPEQDVVAFNAVCTHMGGDLAGDYNPVHKVAGPCVEHLTSFDLTRHGIVVAGHATQALPQIILELEGDDIFATGIVGLVYGYHTNPTVKQGSLADESSRKDAKHR